MVAAGEAVLVRGVGRAVVVVLRGGEVAGPGRDDGIQDKVIPYPGACHGVLRHGVLGILASSPKWEDILVPTGSGRSPLASLCPQDHLKHQKAVKIQLSVA